MEMFSSYAISSAVADDGLKEVGYRKLANDDVIVDIVQVYHYVKADKLQNQ